MSIPEVPIFLEMDEENRSVLMDYLRQLKYGVEQNKKESAIAVIEKTKETKEETIKFITEKIEKGEIKVETPVAPGAPIVTDYIKEIIAGDNVVLEKILGTRKVRISLETDNLVVSGVGLPKALADNNEKIRVVRKDADEITIQGTYGNAELYMMGFYSKWLNGWRTAGSNQAKYTRSTNIDKDIDTAYLDGGTKKNSNLYGLYGYNNAGTLDFTFVTFLRVHTDGVNNFECGTHIDPSADRNYVFTTDIYDGAKAIVLTGTNKGTILDITGNDVNASRTRFTYSGSDLTFSQGDWLMISPAGQSNFVYIMSIHTLAAGDICLFVHWRNVTRKYDGFTYGEFQIGGTTKQYDLFNTLLPPTAMRFYMYSAGQSSNAVSIFSDDNEGMLLYFDTGETKIMFCQLHLETEGTFWLNCPSGVTVYNFGWEE